MTLADQDVPVIAWNEPDGLIPRGTVIVIPGRGELPTVYERFGRRLAGDAYRVRAVADPVADAELARAQISGLLGGGAQRQAAGRHDVLNDQTHRTVAATVVLFLERIRQDSGPRPIAVQERLRR
jgi:hypothetical protein